MGVIPKTVIMSRLVDYLNSICKDKSFELVGLEYDTGTSNIIVLRLFYIPDCILLLEERHQTTKDFDEVFPILVEKMEERLLKNIIFSLPTDGKVIDEN